MHRFFLSASQVQGGIVTISGEDAHHIGFVLRMKPGEEIIVCDMQKNEYRCEIVEIMHGCVKAQVKNITQNDTELPVHVYLYPSIPKGEKAEFVVTKATELGVYKIIFVESERCIVKTDPKSIGKKQERYRKIAESAAKQSGRGMIPEIIFSVPIKEALKLPAEKDMKLFCYEGDGTESIKACLCQNRSEDIHVFIGPEGGYGIGEVRQARENGFKIAGLGRRILRCETAPLFVLSNIIYEKEL